MNVKKLLLLVVLAFGFLNAQAQEKLPALELGEVSIQPYGWIWSTAGSSRADDDISMARFRFNIETETSINGFVELDVTHGVSSDENWLRQAYISYKPVENVSVRVGRLFLAAPMATPPPLLLRTADYMRHPFSAFAWLKYINSHSDTAVVDKFRRFDTCFFLALIPCKSVHQYC